MRSELIRIVTRWEQSGQEEGGMDAEDEELKRSAVFDDETRAFGQVDNDKNSAAKYIRRWVLVSMSLYVVILDKFWTYFVRTHMYVIVCNGDIAVS